METVADYLEACRTLLQDTVEPYRYTDRELQLAHVLGFREMYRVRPDLFVREKLPTLSEISNEDKVSLTIGYETPLIYYMTGYALLRDAEDVTDTRASALMQKAGSQLLATNI